MRTMPEVENRVSEELSEVLAAIVESAEAELVTLGVARDMLKQTLTAEGGKPDSGIGAEQSVYAELESLVEEFGEDAPAVDFVAPKAGEELSELIESLVDEAEDGEGVTLGRVREAIEHGALARLEGKGVLEPDEEPALLAELDRLIERYGADALAEELLRYD